MNKEKNMKTQKELVLNYLKKYKKINPIVAFSKCGTMRLSAIIFNLKKDGWNIDSERKEINTRFGRTSISQYILRGAK